MKGLFMMRGGDDNNRLKKIYLGEMMQSNYVTTFFLIFFFKFRFYNTIMLTYCLYLLPIPSYNMKKK